MNGYTWVVYIYIIHTQSSKKECANGTGLPSRRLWRQTIRRQIARSVTARAAQGHLASFRFKN